MRIVITSRLFFPLRGGVPVVVRLWANAWQQQGHEVRLLTRTPEDPQDLAAPEANCTTVRLPTPWDLWDAARWCDVVVQMEVSLRMVWPFLALGKPCFISHHTHFTTVPQVPLSRRMQQWLTTCCYPVSCSHVIRRSWGGHGIVIGSPYDESIFHLPSSSEPRPWPLLFVGRLVSDKGLDVLLQALVLLRQQGHTPHLRVIGDGFSGSTLVPHWQQQAAALGLDQQVTFLGGMEAAEIAAEMRRSHTLVIPSTWHEPFGIVALEGLASGCHVVASSGGGLPEAGGSFASYFENGNAADLARVLRPRLTAPPAPPPTLDLQAHLTRHSAAATAARFVSYFNSVLG